MCASIGKLSLSDWPGLVSALIYETMATSRQARGEGWGCFTAADELDIPLGRQRSNRSSMASVGNTTQKRERHMVYT